MILDKFLNLKGTSIQGYLHLENIGIVCRIESKNQKAICPRCGLESDKLHQNHRHLVKDLPISGQPVYLQVNRRQFKCDNCRKPFSEELDFVAKKRTYTKRLAENILEQLKEGDILNVSRRNDVTEEEIQRMIEDIAEEITETDLSKLKRLGIDEISLVKGQKNYCAVLVNLDTGKLIAILEKRTQEELRETLTGWGKEVLEQIEEVSIDLWLPYKNLVKELMPSAEVVADRFHVMKQINQELDEQRKAEKRAVEAQRNKKQKAEKEAKLEVLKRSKYSLLKNEKDLTETQKIKLEAIKENFPNLKKMHELKHELKEEFRKIYETSENPTEGMLSISEWLAKSSSVFTKSCQTIRNWFGEIISYFERRTTNGVVEGINNKLKLIKRRGYGFRNFRNFWVRSMLSWHLVC
ncbi:ISL3 family transposase [Microcystis aeruginosa]|uniref:Uma4 protein n=34 Tax=Microcystaceae TaxID=1890449 RepID=A8YD97_MICA7|nr:ISL3 family transposase [Microcystis aeruginosa]ARI81340.1 Uma4 [Microcystis aeruginosa PCC 7806SL]UGS07359.1 ISL3 family transposase [Microcystis aeruginosa FACHB-905 = DIANCHI905]WKX64380.1 ISL3 family transposase [Microcystis aeruginosa PCC 7806]CAO89337.1 uma4 [Microcystis aeruginosa PCC 7806]